MKNGQFGMLINNKTLQKIVQIEESLDFYTRYPDFAEIWHSTKLGYVLILNRWFSEEEPFEILKLMVLTDGDEVAKTVFQTPDDSDWRFIREATFEEETHAVSRYPLDYKDWF